MGRMKGIKDEFEEYLNSGFPEEIAILKSVAHHFAPTTPGVWRELRDAIEKIAKIRVEIIDSVPEKYRDAVKELLACTRTIKKMDVETYAVGWGWFSVELLETLTGRHRILSSNLSIMDIVPSSVVTKWNEEDGEAEFIVRDNDELVMLRSNISSTADFEIIGLFWWADACLLEVKRSVRGQKAIAVLEEILERRGGDVM